MGPTEKISGGCNPRQSMDFMATGHRLPQRVGGGGFHGIVIIEKYDGLKKK